MTNLDFYGTNTKYSNPFQFTFSCDLRVKLNINSWRHFWTYRNKTLDLITDEIDFHARETVIQKDEKSRLLFQTDFILILFQTPLHDLVKKGREMFWTFLEWRPSWNSLPELLVDHHHDRDNVSLWCGWFSFEVGPQVILQILKVLCKQETVNKIHAM